MKGVQIISKFLDIVMDWNVTIRKELLKLQLAHLSKCAGLPKGELILLEEQERNFLPELSRRRAVAGAVHRVQSSLPGLSRSSSNSSRSGGGSAQCPRRTTAVSHSVVKPFLRTF